jgi:GDP-L-fucose synthase
MSMGFWDGKRVVVTGGAGFLGSYVVEQLRSKPCASVFVPRSKDYDLVEMDAVRWAASEPTRRIPVSSSTTT